MTRGLTNKQAEVLAFMREFEAENDNMPTMATVARHFGFASSNAADQHVKALVRAGELVRLEGQLGYRFRRDGCASTPAASTTA